MCLNNHPSLICIWSFLVGTCATGCPLTDLTSTDAVSQCADRGFANTLPIPSGVVCYNRTTTGSEAVYICDEGFHQDGAQRGCARMVVYGMEVYLSAYQIHKDKMV